MVVGIFLLIAVYVSSATAAPSAVVHGTGDIKCPFEPCSVAKCSNFPKAVCVNDYSCGGCNHKYFFNGANVTDKCDPCACVRCPPKTVCNFDGKYLAYCARQCSAPKDCPQGYFCKTNKLVYPPASCIEGGTCGYFAHGYCLKIDNRLDASELHQYY